jgi:hypothetical protein
MKKKQAAERAKGSTDKELEETLVKKRKTRLTIERK